MQVMNSSWNPRLRLHRVAQTDLGFFRRLAQDERVTQFVGDGQPWTDEYVLLRFDAALHSTPGDPEKHVRWFIAEDAAGTPIGLLALTERSNDTEIGYWIHPDSWGQGYAGDLVAHARQLARPQLPLTATVHPQNLASRRVLERYGFVKHASGEGVSEVTYHRGRAIDNP